MSSRSVRFVVPRQDQISGGRVYNTELGAALRTLGWRVATTELAGHWPRVGPAERANLLQALTEPPRQVTVVDGLVGAVCPDELGAAVAAGVPVVLLVHLPLPAETGLSPPQAKQLERLERQAVSGATVVAAPSQWAADDLLQRYGRADIRVLTPGTNPAPLATGSTPPRLTMIGAVTAVKNHATVLRVLAGLTQLPWTLALIGPHPDPDTLGDLRQVIADRGLSERVTLAGQLTGEELERQWQAGDLLVLPSHIETYGLVVTEALARGIPAIVSDGTGAVEALLGHSQQGQCGPGAVAEAGDPSQWRQLLGDWLTQPELRTLWRDRARQRRLRLRRWTDTAHDLEQLLLELR